MIPSGYARLFDGNGGLRGAGAWRLLDGNGGLRGAGAWRLHGKFWEFLGIFERGMGAPLYTPWVCGAAVWNGSGKDLPQGYAGLF